MYQFKKSTQPSYTQCSKYPKNNHNEDNLLVTLGPCSTGMLLLHLIPVQENKIQPVPSLLNAALFSDDLSSHCGASHLCGLHLNCDKNLMSKVIGIDNI